MTRCTTTYHRLESGVIKHAETESPPLRKFLADTGILMRTELMVFGGLDLGTGDAGSVKPSVSFDVSLQYYNSVIKCN